MEEIKRDPVWKSFLYALAGALAIHCSITLGDLPGDNRTGSIMMGIWGATFYAAGLSNLFLARRQEKSKSKESIQ